jgi:hypothetical protein
MGSGAILQDGADLILTFGEGLSWKVRATGEGG